jgi:catechol 2,3-dioxygenase-like lactoylglutathione lyase family enzyme
MNIPILYPHLSINVSDIKRSTEFYRAFFGVDPLKERPGYAKFELQNPKLNFTLNQASEVSHHSHKNVLNHLGFQVQYPEEVIIIGKRLRERGFMTEDEMKTTCCYAVQDKTWITDPDGVKWEVFAVLADADAYSNSGTSGQCCAPEASVPSMIDTSVLSN